MTILKCKIDLIIIIVFWHCATYIVKVSKTILFSIDENCSLVYVDQDLFTEMDVEEDGNVYIKQVVVTLKALNKDIDHNLKVCYMFRLHRNQFS